MNSKINNLVNKIGDILKEHGNHFWYIMLDTKPKLIIRGDSKSKKKLIEKISKNPIKYNDKEFIFVKINTGNQGLMSAGKISILCYLMRLNKELDLIQDPKEKRGKTIWISDQEILDGKFSFKAIKRIINNIYQSKIDMNPFKITTISDIN
tara:strand:- start:156 stop:608 length:453 start_codon:yes stop_codon:yes gene_type:complete